MLSDIGTANGRYMRQQDISVRAANWRFVRVLIVGIHRSERPVWNSPKSVALNDRFDDTGCTAATNLPHLQGNAASAKVENLMSVWSAQQTSMQSAANVRNQRWPQLVDATL